MDITVRTAFKPVTVKAEHCSAFPEPVRHLFAIHKAIDNGKAYVLTHVPSGRAMGCSFLRKRDVRAFAFDVHTLISSVETFAPEYGYKAMAEDPEKTLPRHIYEAFGRALGSVSYTADVSGGVARIYAAFALKRA